MVYTTAFSPSQLSAAPATEWVARTTEALDRLSVDDKLTLLWELYTEMGRSVTPAAPGAARLQLAEGLLADIQAMSFDEQLQAMRDIAAKNSTPVSRSYGVLGTNTKLAFWYRLSEWMDDGSVVPMPQGYKLSEAARNIFDAFVLKLDFSQQITVMRNVVAKMGIDPLA